MALFVDGVVSTSEDLLAYESGLLDAARSEGIDIPTKIELAREEIEIELRGFLAQAGEDDQWSNWKPQIENVAVSEPLHKWHTFQSLCLFYRDAYHSQLNDRFFSKWKEYERLSNWASRWLFQIGVGVVRNPILRPSRPELGFVPGPAAGATFFVAVTWINFDGQESSPSETATVTSLEGSLLVVTPSEAPANAQSWNVYAGPGSTEMALQNEMTLETGRCWTKTGAGFQSGRRPGSGQTGEALVTLRRVLQRG
jgi:hypothetical protein